jgi:RNA polymerase-binding transcription factor DksA
MNDIDLTKASDALRDERKTLIHQLEELGADESGEMTGEVDFGDAFADAGAATAELTETLGLVENLKLQLQDVDAAIGKIADGSYGICVDCGKEIGADRMEFRPNSIRCVSCKASVG